MKWLSVNYPSPSVHKYQLAEGTSEKLVLKYNLEQQSARVSNSDSQRLFFFEKVGGLWNNRINVKNEYGVEIGRLVFDKNYRAGVVEIENKKYHYRVENSSIILYEHDLSMPNMTCDFALTNGNDPAVEYTCLLLGLCWYLSPVPARQSVFARAV
jgi:hypothetical protein